jgi:hypothetical protein
MATVSVVYIGAHAEVEVPDGEFVAQRDVPVDVPEDIATRLLEQEACWQRAESDAQREARERQEKDAAEQEAAAEKAAEAARQKVAAEQAKRNKGGS